MWRHRRLLFVAGLAAFSAGAVYAYRLVRTPLPPEAPLAQSTILTDANGQELARLSSGQNRVKVGIDAVPAVLIDAVVATEDRGFFHHGAVDPVGMMRALFADLSGHRLEGGSTITQQYVKNAFLTPKRTLGRKLREAVLAVKLERRYTKRQILERYLNTIYFGRGAYGVQAASKAYFGVDVGQIDVNRAAFLAGVIRSPELADPFRNPRVATQRRDDALVALVATHRLSPGEAAADKLVPVTSFVRPSAALADPTVQLKDKGSEYFVAYVTAELIRRYGEAMALGGGLRVATTLDPALQSEAYEAVYDPVKGVLTDPRNDPSGAIVTLDTRGRVRAMVGGRDYAVSKVNLAVGTSGGGTGRQAGSTFKPILLAEIVHKGYSLLSQFPAPAEIVIPQGDNGADYRVKNYQGEEYPGTISLLDATKDSVNTVYAQAADAIGPANLVDMAHKLGELTPLPANLSLVLGTTEVSVLEMAGVYSTFMNRGTRVTPHVIDEVRDADGNLMTRTDPAPFQALTHAEADIVTYALQQVVESGTGTGARIGRPLAGKTGTTESNSDAWFVGYTPQLTTAVWMGYRDSKQPMVNVHGVANVNGGSLPAEIFRRYMSRAVTGLPVVAFSRVTYLPGTTLGPPPVTLVPSSTTTTTGSTTSTTSTPPTPTTVSTSTTSTSVLRTGTTVPAPSTTVQRAPPTTAGAP